MKMICFNIHKFLNLKVVRHLIIIAGIFISFFVLDIALRYFSNQYVGFFNFKRSAPNLFTFSWIFLSIGLFYLMGKTKRMVIYPILVVLFNFLTIAEYIHFQIFNRFFGFSDLFLAGEGSNYLLYALKYANLKILLVLLVSLGSMVVTLLVMRKTEEVIRDKYYYIYLVLVTIILAGGFRGMATIKLGLRGDDLTWKAAAYAKNIYIDFNNQNKNMEVSGLYEQFFRNVYLYTKGILSDNSKELKTDIDNYFENNSLTLEENDYTGIIKDKNVIYILMESIDSWLVNEEVMPTLTRLKNEGMNFTNRYAPSFGGAETINSEFAMNTSLYALNNGKAIYNYDSNTYKYSLANMLGESGYSAISIHTNSSKFYNRLEFHEALGYTHYALDDMKNINHSDYNYYNDSSLIKSDDTYNLIVRDDKFLSFLISYSAHVPYDKTNDRCINDPYELSIEGNSELSCVRNLARETDEMLRVLIERLENDGKLDDTVLVLVTDHYMYGYGNQNYIKSIKDTTNEYLLQNVPFIIWGKDIESQEIDTIMDTADILPTLLNMLGISYNPDYYMGEDVFSSYHKDYVYFSKESFFDGNIFYNGEDIRNDENKDYINNILKSVREQIAINDKIILSDYFK